VGEYSITLGWTATLPLPDYGRVARNPSRIVDLIAALMLGDDRRVTKLLKDPAVLRGPFPYSASPLHFARTAKSARLLLSLGVKIDTQDKYGKTVPQFWADAQRPSPVLMRLSGALDLKPPLDIFKAVEQGRLAQVRKVLAGVDVNARFPAGSQQTLLRAAAWNGNLCVAELLVAKGADLRTLDREHETTPAHWARVALKAFNRKPCEAVAEYLEGLMASETEWGSLLTSRRALSLNLAQPEA
jgi:hypothetical protein